MVEMSNFSVAFIAVLIIGVQCHQRDWSEESAQESSGSKKIQKKLVYNVTSSTGEQTQDPQLERSGTQLEQNLSTPEKDAQNWQSVNDEEPAAGMPVLENMAQHRKKSHWSPEYLEKARRKIIEDNATIRETARLFGIDYQTLFQYINPKNMDQHGEISHWSPDYLESARRKMIEDSATIRETARLFGIDYHELFQYINRKEKSMDDAESS